MANILILGGGFAGVAAAEQLSKALAGLHRITLVSTNKNFTFYPALVKLAFGGCTPEEITFDLEEKLNRLDVRFVQGEVLAIDARSRSVRVTGGDFNGEIIYDYLVIALGRRLATEKIPGFFEFAHHLLGTGAARKFGEAVKNFRQGHIVVGLAPESFLPVPVCETAFALAGKFEDEVKAGKIKISVIFPETLKKAFADADLHKTLKEVFQKHNIEVSENFPVGELTKRTIISERGGEIEYDLLMLVPPFRGQTFLSKTDFVNDLNFVEVDNFLRVLNLDKVYAAGDITAFSGPKLAYMATRQAQVAAENIVSELGAGEVKRIYEHEIAAIIDEGGADTIFLHYGIWNESMYKLEKGESWHRMKNMQSSLLEVFRTK